MTTIHETFTESHSRPSETPWTAEENARYQAGRAETVRLAQQRTKKPIVRRFTLASPHEQIVFLVSESTIEIRRIDLMGAAHRAAIKPVTLSLEDGRAEYSRFLNCGYYIW